MTCTVYLGIGKQAITEILWLSHTSFGREDIPNDLVLEVLLVWGL